MCYFFIPPILKARAEILQEFSVPFLAIEFQENLPLRFTDLYRIKKWKFTNF